MATKRILIFAFMVCSATARADSISIAPTAPTNATPVTATVRGASGSCRLVCRGTRLHNRRVLGT